MTGLGRTITAYGALVAGALLLLGSGYYFGYRVAQEAPRPVVIQELDNIGSDASGGKEARADFNIFWQTWDMIRSNYLLDEEVSVEERVYGAAQGLVRSLGDPNSEFFNPKDGKKFQEDIQGNFGGIGAEIGLRDGQIVVVAPLKDTPAERAGLHAGDWILAVNGSSTDGWSVEKAVQMIRGPEGSTVVLDIYRESWETSEETPIVRGRITIPTLDSELVEGDIAHVRLYSFNSNADRMFTEVMQSALSQGARGLIFDLRNNPGGYLEVAVQLAGWFLPQGTLVVSEESRIFETEQFYANGSAALVELPVVVLINQGSASASEILAGALRDQRQVKLVGERSFGKGTVQQIFDLSDGSSVKLTIAHWVLPSGGILDHDGLEPDIEVVLSEDDIAQERDSQLEQAIEVMRGVLDESAE